MTITPANVGKVTIAKRTISVKRLTLSDGGIATITYKDANTPSTRLLLDFCHGGGGQREKDTRSGLVTDGHGGLAFGSRGADYHGSHSGLAP